MAAHQAPDYCRCETLVLGCGNELFGDDGFGCVVARLLSRSTELPEWVLAMDVGTSARKVLFDVVLSEVRPRRVVVVDAVDMGREPGEVWNIAAEELPEVKCDDFSMHQLPTSNLLRELHGLAGIEVSCVVAQVAGIPREVAPGLSAPMRKAVERAARIIIQASVREQGAETWETKSKFSPSVSRT
jgi:coenzyme F420 hydrogenase subunit delta